jgi:hypothetical protein
MCLDPHCPLCTDVYPQEGGTDNCLSSSSRTWLFSLAPAPIAYPLTCLSTSICSFYLPSTFPCLHLPLPSTTLPQPTGVGTAETLHIQLSSKPISSHSSSHSVLDAVVLAGDECGSLGLSIMEWEAELCGCGSSSF